MWIIFIFDYCIFDDYYNFETPVDIVNTINEEMNNNNNSFESTYAEKLARQTLCSWANRFLGNFLVVGHKIIHYLRVGWR